MVKERVTKRSNPYRHIQQQVTPKIRQCIIIVCLQTVSLGSLHDDVYCFHIIKYTVIISLISFQISFAS